MDAGEYEFTDDIRVLYVQAEKFPEGITDAFYKLEALTGDLKDHHVYGITECTGEKLIYMACIKESFAGQAEQYGLPVYTIPKGQYLYYTLTNWRENIGQIPVLFDEFNTLPNVKKQTICLEDYLSDGAMWAMVQKA
jgi:hypothetical protein